MGRLKSKKKPAPKKQAIVAAGAPRAIVMTPIKKLSPYARNSREHSAEQIEQLVGSIEQFGFTIPVLIDERGVIIAGHGRVLAAEKRGMTHVPTIVAANWSEDLKRAYVIADNKLAENATWDKLKLGSELGSLALAGFDTSILGFARGEIAALIANAKLTKAEPDDAPPAPDQPVSIAGDLWVLGDHRVLCGDATSPQAVGLLLSGSAPHLMVTDPPYGVNYDPAWRARAGVGSKGAASGPVLNDDRADWRAAWALFPGAVAYVWHGGLHCGEVEASLKACKFQIRAQIVWVKSRAALSRGHYHWQHEPALYALQAKAKDDFWRFDEDHENSAYAVRLGTAGDGRPRCGKSTRSKTIRATPPRSRSSACAARS